MAKVCSHYKMNPTQFREMTYAECRALVNQINKERSRS